MAMRSPTTNEDALAFWRDAVEHFHRHGTMKGFPRKIYESSPECGFYRRRYGKDQDWKPARIFFLPREFDAETGELVNPERLGCEINGIRKDPISEWTYLVSQPITEKEYRRLESERLAALF